jgi:hypothetical protein
VLAIELKGEELFARNRLTSSRESPASSGAAVRSARAGFVPFRKNCRGKDGPYDKDTSRDPFHCPVHVGSIEFYYLSRVTKVEAAILNAI